MTSPPGIVSPNPRPPIRANFAGNLSTQCLCGVNPTQRGVASGSGGHTSPALVRAVKCARLGVPKQVRGFGDRDLGIIQVALGKHSTKFIELRIKTRPFEGEFALQASRAEPKTLGNTTERRDFGIGSQDATFPRRVDQNQDRQLLWQPRPTVEFRCRWRYERPDRSRHQRRSRSFEPGGPYRLHAPPRRQRSGVRPLPILLRRVAMPWPTFSGRWREMSIDPACSATATRGARYENSARKEPLHLCAQQDCPLSPPCSSCFALLVPVRRSRIQHPPNHGLDFTRT